MGHAHIDLGWLWPIRITHHKCVRTFATQVRLLKQYPDWVFQQSSPQAYKWLETDAPDLLAEIKQLIKAGRWEADGATWCECDMNVTGAESLVRQLLYGKRYFAEKLDVNSRYLWLPDVFGYSAALPQLLKLADCDAFITSKISWNEFNRFPYDTFRWRGLDGSEIPVQFITTACSQFFFTYNSVLICRRSPGQLAKLPAEGPDRPITAVLRPRRRRRRAHGDDARDRPASGRPNPHQPACPNSATAPSAIWSQGSREKAPHLPVWDGELYLELHRGTYTTQGWTKRANRKNETRLHNLEWLSSLAGPHWLQVRQTSRRRPLGRLDAHAVPRHPPRLVRRRAVRRNQSHARATRCQGGRTGRRRGEGTRQPDRHRPAWKSRSCCSTPSPGTEPIPIRLPDGTCVTGVTVPAAGWTVIDAAKQAAAAKNKELVVKNLPPGTQHSALSSSDSALSTQHSALLLETPFWQIELGKKGHITSLFDRRSNRQVLPEGHVANLLEVFEDRSANWDAWDIPHYYTEHPLPGPALDSLKVVEHDATHVTVEMHYAMPIVGKGPQSTITQRMIVYADNPRIDFATEVDWHDHHVVLKAAFPVDVRATEATYQVQWGHLTRPTHSNTSWDAARFEVCGHRFADLGEHGYGVALMNDCKYGYHIEGNLMRLTLLRSPTAPHAFADQGFHEFTYSLLPHAGSFQDAGVIRAAAELNVPVIAVPVKDQSGKLPATFRYVACDNPAVVIETIKPAEDGNGTILRLYESHGSHAQATLTFAVPPKTVEHVNLLEQRHDEDIALMTDASKVALRLRPFQIVTLRVE